MKGDSEMTQKQLEALRRIIEREGDSAYVHICNILQQIVGVDISDCKTNQEILNKCERLYVKRKAIILLNSYGICEPTKARQNLLDFLVVMDIPENETTEATLRKTIYQRMEETVHEKRNLLSARITGVVQQQYQKNPTPFNIMFGGRPTAKTFLVETFYQMRSSEEGEN